MKKLVYGVGINDADYVVIKTINDKRDRCPFYARWISMLERCYSEKVKLKYPTYTGCSVCSEWLTFSNFKAWMEQQDWRGKQLDKDILAAGNKIYSPETCAFVDARCNSFIEDSAASRGKWPLGVSYQTDRGKFIALCKNPFSGKEEFLGRFTCQHTAHTAWKRRKHQLACLMAETQSDYRIVEALKSRYLG